jgi:hypothetical protein
MLVGGVATGKKGEFGRWACQRGSRSTLGPDSQDARKRERERERERER